MTRMARSAHWQDSTTKTEDTMAELMKLKQEGKIRAIGCSNATLEQMRRCQASGQLDVDQEQYSVGARDSAQAVVNAKAGEVQSTDEEIKTIRKTVDRTIL
jgi:aryl-alcohol dehydrogenase-like predicted oxidoreductase